MPRQIVNAIILPGACEILAERCPGVPVGTVLRAMVVADSTRPGPFAGYCPPASADGKRVHVGIPSHVALDATRRRGNRPWSSYIMGLILGDAWQFDAAECGPMPAPPIPVPRPPAPAPPARAATPVARRPSVSAPAKRPPTRTAPKARRAHLEHDDRFEQHDLPVPVPVPPAARVRRQARDTSAADNSSTNNKETLMHPHDQAHPETHSRVVHARSKTGSHVDLAALCERVGDEDAPMAIHAFATFDDVALDEIEVLLRAAKRGDTVPLMLGVDDGGEPVGWLLIELQIATDRLVAACEDVGGGWTVAVTVFPVVADEGDENEGDENEDDDDADDPDDEDDAAGEEGESDEDDSEGDGESDDESSADEHEHVEHAPTGEVEAEATLFAALVTCRRTSVVRR